MRRIVLLGVLLVGCVPTVEMPPPESGMVRVFAGERVVGHYVSPTAYEHYLRAQLASLGGHAEDAVDALRRALVSDGASAYLRTRLAEELLGLGRVDEAREELEAAIRIDARFADAHVDLGRIQLQLGDAAAAERSFRLAFDIDRTCEDAYLALAQIYEERGDRRADELYRTLEERVPQSAAAHYHLAHAAARRGELSATEAELRHVLELDPLHGDACRELGELLFADGRGDAGGELLRACVERSGDLSVAATLLRLEAAVGHADQVSAALEKLVELGAGPVERRVQIGWLFVEHGQAQRVIAMLDALAKAQPTVADQPAVALLRGTALGEVHHLDEALAQLKRVPALAPEFARAQLRIARLHLEDEHFADAARGLEAALAQVERPGDADTLVEALAEVRERAGDRGAALRVLQSAQKARPSSEVLAYALARLLERGGEWQQAIAVVRPLLTRRPDDADAMNFIGYTMVEHGAPLDEPRRLLETAAGLRPTSGDVADSLGWLYCKAGRVGDAERWLLRASRLLGDQPEVLAHLGSLYLRQGDRAHALEVLRRALTRKPEERLRHAVEEQLILIETGRVGAR